MSKTPKLVRKKPPTAPKKFVVPICLLPQRCDHKRTDKKTKLPICVWFSRKTGRYYHCSQQFFVSKTWLAHHKPDLETLRRMRYKYIKAGVE